MFAGDRAEAQGSHNGYTYSRLVCQEYGQQPRWYKVRDEIDGSDWRSDGGWAIVLDGGSNTAYTFGAPVYIAGAAIPTLIELTTPVRREKKRVTDSSAGIAGFLTYFADGDIQQQVIVDRNNDWDITTADRTAGAGNDSWEIRGYTTAEYGGSYIRWANMRWCRA